MRSATHVPAELPRLSGPEGTESQVAQRYLSAQGRMLEAGMRIAALRLDERGAWEMDLDSGVTVRLGGATSMSASTASSAPPRKSSRTA